MLRLLRLLLGSFRRLLSSRRDLLFENLALRQQLMVFKRHDSRPMIESLDKLFWVVTRRLWSEWKQALVVVTPRDGRGGGIGPDFGCIGVGSVVITKSLGGSESAESCAT